jgi:putative hydroxymethylpyrimidine transport system ATP-binding protein
VLETVFFMHQQTTKAATPIRAPSIDLRGVSFAYEGVPLFRRLHFAIRGGRWTCLLGPSGCGKSTLLRLIAGNLQAGVTGDIAFDDRPRPERQTAWMAQKDLLLPWLSVLENVCLGARLRGRLSEATYSRARDLISKAGLDDVVDALPSVLSGGMRQRAALLRTLMEGRPVILMDEPFSALDALTRLKLQNLAAELVQGATVVLVTHDPMEALRMGHTIHVMRGKPAAIGPPLSPLGRPPRDPSDPVLAELQGELLARLNGEELTA